MVNSKIDSAANICTSSELSRVDSSDTRIHHAAVWPYGKNTCRCYCRCYCERMPKKQALQRKRHKFYTYNVPVPKIRFTSSQWCLLAYCWLLAVGVWANHMLALVALYLGSSLDLPTPYQWSLNEILAPDIVDALSTTIGVCVCVCAPCWVIVQR